MGSKNKKGKIKYPKGKNKSIPKRTLKELHNGKKIDSQILSKKRNPNNNNSQNNIINQNISNIYDNLVFDNNDIIQYKKDNFQNIIYEEDFFQLITITGDGNCLFRTLSYYLDGDKNPHKIYVNQLINMFRIIKLNFMIIVTQKITCIILI